jgi:hypothetical protein
MMTIGNITRFGPGSDGLCKLSVQVTEHVSALVDGYGIEDQDEMDRVAGSIAAAGLAEATLRNQIADLEAGAEALRAVVRRLRSQSEEREDRLDIVLGRTRGMTFGPMAAREEPDGSVWVGDADEEGVRGGWRGRFAVRFSSWADLRQTWPHLAPSGLRIDADGRPAVLLAPMSAARPDGKEVGQ